MIFCVSKQSQENTTAMSTTKKRVAIIGSGNWACAIAKIVGNNCKRDDEFEDEVRMWVFEEIIDGKKLTEIINSEHENVKYMKGIKLPTNVVADPDVVSATKGANVLIFVLPHQFLGGLCKKIAGNHHSNCIAISLIKAVHFDETGIVLISDMIKKGLGGMDVSVLMGANLAVEVARGAFCETTIGYRVEQNGAVLKKIFDDPLFHVSIVNDVEGVEVCGALKNVRISAISNFSAGFMVGLGRSWPSALVSWTEWNLVITARRQ
jgi:glycerol-3-phosphate dehydrogenase (NAD+)